MKPKTLRLKRELPEEEVDVLAGHYLDESHYDHLIQKDTNVYKPDGTLLIIFRCGVIPEEQCRAAFPALRKAGSGASNRGLAAGVFDDPNAVMLDNRKCIPVGENTVRARPVKFSDGTLSNTTYAKTVPSGIIGYFDRYPRIPYCRLTSFNLEHPEKFAAALPLIKTIDQVFEKEAPDRYAAQKAKIKATSQDFVINGTAFTTITVNKNWRTAVHKDKGDLPEGFGVMTALRAGLYKGCYLVFPKYRVAVDMTTRCVCLADVHQWHGNTPLVGVKGAFERISLVLYYREKMIECGSAAEELRRAKKLGIRCKQGE